MKSLLWDAQRKLEDLEDELEGALEAKEEGLTKLEEHYIGLLK